MSYNSKLIYSKTPFIVLKDGNPNNAHAGNIMWVESEEDKAKKKKENK